MSTQTFSVLTVSGRMQRRLTAFAYYCWRRGHLRADDLLDDGDRRGQPSLYRQMKGQQPWSRETARRLVEHVASTHYLYGSPGELWETLDDLEAGRQWDGWPDRVRNAAPPVAGRLAHFMAVLTMRESGARIERHITRVMLPEFMPPRMACTVAENMAILTRNLRQPAPVPPISAWRRRRQLLAGESYQPPQKQIVLMGLRDLALFLKGSSFYEGCSEDVVEECLDNLLLRVENQAGFLFGVFDDRLRDLNDPLTDRYWETQIDIDDGSFVAKQAVHDLTYEWEQRSKGIAVPLGREAEWRKEFDALTSQLLHELTPAGIWEYLAETRPGAPHLPELDFAFAFSRGLMTRADFDVMMDEYVSLWA